MQAHHPGGGRALHLEQDGDRMRRSKRDNIYRRGKIWWTLHPETGKRVSTGCRDEAAARLWRTERERRRADSTYISSRETTIRVGVNRWVAEVRAGGAIAATIEDYKRKLGAFVRVHGELKPLASVDRRAVGAYTTKRLEEGASRITVRRERAYLAMMLRAAYRRLAMLSKSVIRLRCPLT